MKIDLLAKTISRDAKIASHALYAVRSVKRNRVLLHIARSLLAHKVEIIRQNNKDLIVGRKKGLSEAMLERLLLNEERIAKVANAVKSVAAQPDPVGFIDSEKRLSNGILLSKVRVPIGVVFIVYESRPNVTVDSAALAIKSGNCVILRGGKEAMYSNMILADILRNSLSQCGLQKNIVQLVSTTDREIISLLVKESDNINLVIPRGGESLIRFVTENSKIPVLKHYKGVCHVFVEKDADLHMAENIILNAKIQRPGVCNAMETLLLDNKLPDKSALQLINALLNHGVELLGCDRTRKLSEFIGKAKVDDYYSEYLSLKANVKFVNGVAGAAEHITKFGSAHTDSIVTSNKKKAEEFISLVDSSSVMWNVSTRLADGGEYGLGAEIGISTDKIHSRGPMGAYDLTTYKWVVVGNGQIRK